MDEKQFTAKVITVENTEHLFKDLKQEHVERFKQLVWQQGCTIRINETTSEQISPFRIKQVLFIKQL